MVTTQHESLKKKTHLPSLIMKIFVYLSAAITFTVLILLIAYIMIKGIPHLKPEFFSLHYTSDNVSFVPALITTVIMTALALIVAVPLGLFAAIYLVEYTGKRKKLVGIIRLTTETLSGIPSIVYGLFGMLFFVNTLEMGFSILAGAATLSIMILPLILRTTEEALLSVPDSYREGSFGLGAGRLRTVFKVILPPAAPGILAGVILAIGRIVGESAALIFTSGSGTANLTFGQTGVFWKDLFAPLFQSTRTLSVHMYNLMNEGLYMNEARATAVVLLALVIGINALSALTAKRLIRGKGEK